MTPLTPTCRECAGKGWVKFNDWPVECPKCCPTKVVRGRIVIDKGRVTALTERRKPIPVIKPRPRPHLFDLAQED